MLRDSICLNYRCQGKQSFGFKEGSIFRYPLLATCHTGGMFDECIAVCNAILEEERREAKLTERPGGAGGDVWNIRNDILTKPG